MSHIAEYIEQAKLMLKAPILTGFDFLDNIMGGYYPGQVTTICGGENIGKSAFVVHQINRIALDHSIPTLLVLDQKSQLEFLASMAAYYCDVICDNILDIFVQPIKDDIIAYLRKLESCPLYIVEWKEEKRVETIEEICNIVRDNKVQIAFFDGVNDETSPASNSPGYFEKSLAVEFNIPVIKTLFMWEMGDPFKRIYLYKLGTPCGFHGGDVVIGLTRYLEDPFQEEEYTGWDGYLEMEVIKHKGDINSEVLCSRFPQIQLYLRNYVQNKLDKAKESLTEMKQNPAIAKMLDCFDLQIDGDNIIPF
jgi:hypothetical protein